VFQPAALQTMVFAQRQTNDVWGLYILARIGRRYMAGVPTDAEPPAMR
jgi:hypothetical protein